MKSSKTLIIVDFQKDFYDRENGSLYVNGAENCVEPICKAIASGQFDQVIFTLDWHLPEDHSFQINGGPWPVHCIQHSAGAALHPALLEAVTKAKVPYCTFVKGNLPEHEEYGAFEKFHTMSASQTTYATNFLADSAVIFDTDTEYTICGLAGDFCVHQTYKNLIPKGLKVTLFKEGTAFIGEPFDYESQKTA